MEIQKSQINVRFWEEQTVISKPVNMLTTSYDKKGQVVPYTTKSLQVEIFHHAFKFQHQTLPSVAPSTSTYPKEAKFHMIFVHNQNTQKLELLTSLILLRHAKK